MPTQAQVPTIVAEVRRRLDDVAKRGIHLKVASKKLEDGWLYIVVTPSRPGERASDHARIMSEIERDLRTLNVVSQQAMRALEIPLDRVFFVVEDEADRDLLRCGNRPEQRGRGEVMNDVARERRRRRERHAPLCRHG